jgi:hypothetical protein
VSSTGLCNDGTKILLEGIHGNETLISLSMRANEITNIIINEITDSIISTNLEYLDVSYNNFGNNGISDL